WSAESSASRSGAPHFLHSTSSRRFVSPHSEHFILTSRVTPQARRDCPGLRSGATRGGSGYHFTAQLEVVECDLVGARPSRERDPEGPGQIGGRELRRGERDLAHPGGQRSVRESQEAGDRKSTRLN